MTKNTKSKSKKQEEPTKNVREGSQFPYLKKNLNTKRRRDYLDNIYYVEGVESVDSKNKDLGIRGLNDEEKQWLNRFNKEFYGASFDKDDSNNLHKTKASEEEIQALRHYISGLREEARNEEDPDAARDLYDQIQLNVEILEELYPRKKCTDANNSRNRCLLNKAKATNEIKFIPWESLDQNTIGESDIELLYILNDQEREDD